MAKRPVEIEDDLDDLQAVDVSNDVLAQMGRAKKAEDDDDDSDDDSEDARWEDADEDDDSDDDDSDDDSDDDDSDDDYSDDEPVAKKADDAPKKKRKQTAAERIAELTAAKHAAEKAAFEAEMRAIELEKAQQAAASGTPESQVAAPAKPDPKDFVYGDVDPAYQEALIDYRVAEKLAKQKAEFETTQKTQTEAQRNAEYQAKLATVMTEGTKRHKDFEETVNSTKFDAHLARLILDSEKAVDIAYYMSKNIGELIKATRAAPEERARIIGRLEGRFSATSAARKRRTGAPEPIGSNRKSSSPKGKDAKYGPSDQDAFDKAFYG